MTIPHRLVTTISLCSAPLFFLYAQSACTQTTEDDFFSDLPVVISASRLNQSVLNSPSSVTVIDKAMIEASGFIEFVDLLRLAPGFQVAHVNGRKYAAVYHGYGSDIANKIQVLVNGRSTYTPTLSTVEWDMLGVRLEDIERLEVVRGPSASAYGSNSFTAAINIITKSPELDESLHLRSRIGNKGERDYLLRHSDSVKSMSYRVTAATRENDGFDDFSDSRDSDHLSFHGSFNQHSNKPIDIYLHYIDGTSGTEEFADILAPRDRQATSWSAHIKGSHIFSATEEVKWSLYHNDDDVFDLSNTIPLFQLAGVPAASIPAVFGDPNQTFTFGLETNDATKTDIEIEYSSSNLEGLKYVIGTGVRYDTLSSPSFFDEKGRVSDSTYRLFANGQIALSDHVTLNGGALFEHTKNYDSKTSPRASLNWQISEFQSIRLAASKGFRFPSLLERNFDTRTTLENGIIFDELFFSDPDIQPEEISTVEIGYLGKLQNLPISWDIKAYKEKISGILLFPQDNSVIDLAGDGARRITNGLNAKSYGIEGEVTYRTSNHSFIKFLFNRGHSKGTEIDDIVPISVDTIRNGVPRESYGMIGAVDMKSWAFSISAFHTGGVRWFNTGSTVDSYTRVDASISKSFKLPNHEVFKIKLVGQNIGNDYNEYDNALSFEPRYYVNLSFTHF